MASRTGNFAASRTLTIDGVPARIEPGGQKSSLNFRPQTRVAIQSRMGGNPQRLSWWESVPTMGASNPGKDPRSSLGHRWVALLVGSLDGQNLSIPTALPPKHHPAR